jgi:hypothetical protein
MLSCTAMHIGELVGKCAPLSSVCSELDSLRLYAAVWYMLQKLSFYPGGDNLLLLPGFKEPGSIISPLALQEQEFLLLLASASTSRHSVPCRSSNSTSRKRSVSVPYGPGTPCIIFKKGKSVLAHGHMPHDIGLRLSARGSSGAAMRFVAPAPAPSFSRFRCRHVSRGVNSRVSAWGSSGVATCPVVPAPTSRLGAARVPPCIPWHQLPPPCSRQLGCRHRPTLLCRPWAIKVYEYSPVELLL